MNTTELLTKVETAVRYAGKWPQWNSKYMGLRSTHSPREAALLALQDAEVELVKVAIELTGESLHAHGQ